MYLTSFENPILLILANYALMAGRYFLVAGFTFALFYGFRKGKWTIRKIQEKWPDRNKINFEIKYSLISLGIFTAFKSLIAIAWFKGHTQLYTSIHDHSIWWFVLSFPLLLFIHDTWFYWTHRLMHHPRIFRHVHLVHHKSTNPTPWAAFSFHPLEAIVEFGFVPLIVFILPLHPIPVLFLASYMIIFNVIGHSGFEIFNASFIFRPLTKWLNTSTHHNMHHKYFKGNYGLYFNFWDKVMGTNHPDYEQEFVKVANKPVHKHQQKAESLLNEG